MIISFSLLLFIPRTAYSSDEYDETAHKYRVQQNITNISERPQYVRVHTHSVLYGKCALFRGWWCTCVVLNYEYYL